MRRGFSLTGVLALCLFFFVLFIALSNALTMNRQRMVTEKLKQAAMWMSVSGADLAQARLSKGQMKAGQTLTSPDFQEGSFKVVTRATGGGVQVESTGYAGGQSYLAKRTVRR